MAGADALARRPYSRRRAPAIQASLEGQPRRDSALPLVRPFADPLERKACTAVGSRTRVPPPRASARPESSSCDDNWRPWRQTRVVRRTIRCTAKPTWPFPTARARWPGLSLESRRCLGLDHWQGTGQCYTPHLRPARRFVRAAGSVVLRNFLMKRGKFRGTPGCAYSVERSGSIS